jgi:hypothetical protein
VVGHSPTNEAAVSGLVGQTIAAMGKGEGVLVVEDAAGMRCARSTSSGRRRCQLGLRPKQPSDHAARDNVRRRVSGSRGRAQGRFGEARARTLRA